MTERVPPAEADLPDDIPCGDEVDEVWQSGGEWYGADEHGEFKLRRGSAEPLDPDDVTYDPCNAVCKYTFERYGERRYCTGPSEQHFGGDNPFCKHHRHRMSNREAQAERFVTGAHAKSHESIYQYMDPHERVVANELYKSLVDESVYDFDTEIVDVDIDVSDVDFGGDHDTLVMSHPVPTNRKTRCKALWHAALDFITMESIREEQFREAMENDKVNAVGQEWTVVATGEEGPVYDTDEHHLNLPLSRFQKDYKEHLEFGGVGDDADVGDESEEREFILELEPSGESRLQPEARTVEPAPVEEVEPDEDV